MVDGEQDLIFKIWDLKSATITMILITIFFDFYKRSLGTPTIKTYMKITATNSPIAGRVAMLI
jgi:hypothetical protein